MAKCYSLKKNAAAEEPVDLDLNLTQIKIWFKDIPRGHCRTSQEQPVFVTKDYDHILEAYKTQHDNK